MSHASCRTRTFLSYVVQFDAPRLGDIAGLRGVHLQCHIGTDTISLARLGARMTGLDFSPAALTEARRIAALAGAEVDFVQAEVYDAVSALGAGRFDLVYTGAGALGWLPDIRRWARTVADLLRPGGRLFIREAHPMMWSLDEERSDGVLAVDYPYFETPEPLVFEDDGTYVETDMVFVTNTTHSWNHGLGEIVGAVLEAGMELTGVGRASQRPVGGAARSHGARRALGVASAGATGAAAVDVYAAGAQDNSLNQRATRLAHARSRANRRCQDRSPKIRSPDEPVSVQVSSIDTSRSVSSASTRNCDETTQSTGTPDPSSS